MCFVWFTFDIRGNKITYYVNPMTFCALLLLISNLPPKKEWDLLVLEFRRLKHHDCVKGNMTINNKFHTHIFKHSCVMQTPCPCS